MKKILSMILVLTLLMGLSVNAFAAETSSGGDTSINVKGIYNSVGGEEGDVVSVGVAWGAMEFTYQVAGEYWDAASHTTKTNGTTGWTASGNDITLTNHSNVNITAAFAFTTAVDGVDGSFYDAAADGTEKTSLSLERAAEGSELDSVKETVYFVINEGAIAQNYDTLGTITVSIAKEQVVVEEVVMKMRITYQCYPDPNASDDTGKSYVEFYDSEQSLLKTTDESTVDSYDVIVPTNAAYFKIYHAAYSHGDQEYSDYNDVSALTEVPTVSSYVYYVCGFDDDASEVNTVTITPVEE